MRRLLSAAAGQMRDTAPKVKCGSEVSFPMNRVGLKASASSPYL
jgi:hypothetical protein